MSAFMPLYVMSNEALLDETTRLASNERSATAKLIAAISEIDARGLYPAEGCSSVSQYCIRVLRLSEHAAFNRVTAARLAKRFPVILERLADGTLTLSNLSLLAPHLTPDNCQNLLDAVAYKSKREVEAIAAELRPQIATPECYRLQLSISKEAWDQLRHVQDLLRHSIPDGDPSRIFERAVALLLTKIEKEKFGKTDKPRTPRGRRIPSRYVTASVRREVSERDQYSCAFIGPHGRCGETRGLEFHHLEPYAKGGETTAKNIELRCRRHNQYESLTVFGRGASEWRRKKHRSKGNAPSAKEFKAGMGDGRAMRRRAQTRTGTRPGRRRVSTDRVKKPKDGS